MEVWLLFRLNSIASGCSDSDHFLTKPATGFNCFIIEHKDFGLD